MREFDLDSLLRGKKKGGGGIKKIKVQNSDRTFKELSLECRHKKKFGILAQRLNYSWEDLPRIVVRRG